MDRIDALSATLINVLLALILATAIWGPAVLAGFGVLAAPIALGIILKLTTVSRL